MAFFCRPRLCGINHWGEPMRRSAFRVSVSLGILVLFAFSAQLSAQPAQTYMGLMTDIKVKPSMIGQFREALKAWVAFYGAHNGQYGWAAQLSDDYHCLLVSQFAEYADIGKMFSEDEAFSAKFAAESKALNDKLTASYEGFTSYIVTFRPDLSIYPENPREGEGNPTFFTFDIWYIIPGQEQEFEKLSKEMVALCKAKKVAEGWKCMVGGIGADQPVYIWRNLDKGPAEFWTHNAEMWNTLGKEVTPIYEKMEKMLRKRESKTYWFDAELSYMPKK